MAHFEIQNLTFAYPEEGDLPRLRGINLSIQRGEYVVICGRSGSGKTTLLRQLKTMLTPAGKKTGEILLDGTPLGQLSLIHI